LCESTTIQGFRCNRRPSLSQASSAQQQGALTFLSKGSDGRGVVPSACAGQAKSQEFAANEAVEVLSPEASHGKPYVMNTVSDLETILQERDACGVRSRGLFC